MSNDVCEDLVSALRTGPDAELVAIRALLAKGADSIYESGDARASVLNEAEEQRRTDETFDKALLLVVQDAGEERDRNTTVYQQTIVIRIIDRLCGYHNIRALRLALLEYLRSRYTATLPTGYAALGLEYLGRTGHQYDRTAGVEFEAITFRGHVDYPEN